ncbi:lamin tail domain-containing protein, partial [Candidatus Bipolaricaulota bacterium]|nr:lamin tail domain-containing protein [Candidatus Bipolaricaulota bacterium]
MNRMSRSAMLMVIGLYLLGHGVLADDLIISEVAWGGTLGSVNDEWIELRNTTDQPIDLAGWVLTFNNAQIPLGEVGENAIEVRTAVLAPGAFYLMERTDDNAVADVRADLLYYKALSNTGDRIELRNPDGVVVDFVGESLGVAWPAGSAGSGEPPCVTMERTGTGEWVSNNGVICNGVDKDGNPLNGTPGQPNSVDVIADLAPTTVATASAGALVISEVAWGGTLG